MSSSKIPRGKFRNPHPDLNNAAAKTAVDSLLAKVKKAHEEFGDPTPRDYQIAGLKLLELQRLVYPEPKLTMREVVEARIRLTVKASLQTHCLTAFPYEEALEQADDMDDYGVDTHGGTLFGLVFSVKDCIHVDGFPTTLGCSLRAGHNEAASSELVLDMMHQKGGIMIAKTTCPQLMMSNTTESPLWGTTRSAIKSAQGESSDEADEFQVGGSSGGEASLVKMGGSMLGVGTDMGGSIRQPACLNELFGYKFTSIPPRAFRWELPNDYMTGLPHITVPATAPGLLARDCTTIKAATEALYFDVGRDIGWDVFTEPKPEYRASIPRIIFTTQQSSPEVANLIEWLVDHLKENEDAMLRPRRSDELGEVDVKAWGEAWMDHATEQGFDDARAMLADDPLIMRTMFDEERLLASAEEKKAWKADGEKLERLKQTFLRQAAVGEYAKKDDDEVAGADDADTDDDGSRHSEDDPKVENVIFVTPTYVLGTPVQNASFIALDDAGESEIWCQIFNLLDWPSISIPIRLDSDLRQQFRDAALSSPTWAKHLAGPIEPDPIDKDAEPRLPRLSLQLATLPGNQLGLLDYVARIDKLFSNDKASSEDWNDGSPGEHSDEAESDGNALESED